LELPLSVQAHGKECAFDQPMRGPTIKLGLPILFFSGSYLVAGARDSSKTPVFQAQFVGDDAKSITAPAAALAIV